MKKNLKIIEENMIKDVRNPFKQKKKEIDDNAIKDVNILFRLEKENEAIKNKITRDIRNLFELEYKKENYYKQIRAGNFWSNNYIKYENNNDRNRALNIE